MNPERQKEKMRVYRTTSLAICVLLFCLLVGVFYIHSYDEGVLQVYARQQDAYIQLVLDQINLLKDGSSAEDITAILETMDSSNRKFWTLSENDTLIFVKNVQETNRYKGFSTATFFASDEGLTFLDDMKLNYVEHQIIELDNERYVVSGTVFQFGKRQYTVCLMTDVDVVLQENAFLSAKIVLYVTLVAMVILAGVASVSLADLVRKKILELDDCDAQIVKLNKTIEKLNHRINKNDMFHPRWNMYKQTMIPEFLSGFEQKNVEEISFAIIEFESDDSKTEFLENALVYLDKSVLRFMINENENRVFLLFVNTDETEAKRQLQQFDLKKDEVRGVSTWKKGSDSAITAANTFYADVTGDKL